MGLAVYVEKGRFVVEHANGDIVVGLNSHANNIFANGLLTDRDVVRMQNPGSTLFLRNDETKFPIAIGFRDDEIGATATHSAGLMVDVKKVKQRLDGLLLFVYSGPESFVQLLNQYTSNNN